MLKKSQKIKTNKIQ